MARLNLYPREVNNARGHTVVTAQPYGGWPRRGVAISEVAGAVEWQRVREAD